jgi:hypothetical protein
VRFAYGSTVSSGALNVGVRAGATLAVSLRGTALRYRGRVLSKPLPRAGKRVILEGKAPGYPWAMFATRRTDRRGRFSGRYRLSVRRPGVRLQIRVRVPAQRGYPFLAATGHPVALLVR